MAKFSDRYGYTNPNDIIIREKIPTEIINAILDFVESIRHVEAEAIEYDLMEDPPCIDYAVWCNFLCEQRAHYCYSRDSSAIGNCFYDDNLDWFEKINLLEFILSEFKKNNVDISESIAELNNRFAQRNFAYRVVGEYVEEVTSNEEIESIKEAFNTPINGVSTHLNEALKLLSVSNKTPHYRNSIKESISAVECFCRARTNKKSLGDALKELKKSGLVINSQMITGFENLYYYTNSKETGIRHSLMEDTHPPTADEAIYMLVTCSAFINYLKKKVE